MNTDLYRRAQRLLARRDPVMQRLIATHGPCTLQPNPDHFGVLARSIISQQISTRAALSIGNRLLATLAPDGLNPAAILKAEVTVLRGAGLSESKVKSLRDLSAKVDAGVVPLDQLHAMDDEAVIEALIPVRGIGRWTAEMFLIFSLGRLDVLAVDDLGLKTGVQRQYGLAAIPKREALREYGGPWRPYRSIATWYLWRSLGGVPQSSPS
jgi:DNA-3-methyladenine glycosylase II